ncbi:Zn(2)-Cys(6) zinc finger domain protein [Metarhizium robertsii]|uniref:Zn(2)-Cys(6) zinc finger domain protein n=1 Tax=Metarhizium robertsii TaxID=568076 RepID=A0A014N5G4_9HYPO|nr:Zn(2)-Cys(6) zinc finger domain protein [Metarhizium robertsii]
MTGKRSRQGCEECRRRRRKCNEQKPRCGQCSAFNRTCKYSLRLVWGNARKYNKASEDSHGPRANETKHLAREPPELSRVLPRSLPNGIQLPPKYQRLLSYFVDNVLASLSCHPLIHEDLRTGLVPIMLESPQLMSACLALSAAGLLSRGTLEMDGVQVLSILGHLQTSGLALLRNALGTGQMVETLLATCLVWCLTDVFTHREGMSSWRVHLQGIKALLNTTEAHGDSIPAPGSIQSAMRHLYQLYLSLQTLPYIPNLESTDTPARLGTQPSPMFQWAAIASPEIDGFLGYSNELLDVLQQIDRLSQLDTHGEAQRFETDMLLGKLKGMMLRDAKTPPHISIGIPLSAEHGRDFALCHQTFQQATLIHLYRRLYHLPSGSLPIQAAVRSMEEMVSSMIQGQPCHTWVAMAMPLFTLGCEAYTKERQLFVLDKINKLEECIGSLHVKLIRQASRDVWKVRERLGDGRGALCAHQLLSKYASGSFRLGLTWQFR